MTARIVTCVSPTNGLKGGGDYVVIADVADAQGAMVKVRPIKQWAWLFSPGPPAPPHRPELWARSI